MINTYFVYALLSLKDGDLYIGQTFRLRARFLDHQKGKVRSTKSRRPLILAHWEEVNSREEAVAKEKEWKGTTGRRKLKKIILQKMDLQGVPLSALIEGWHLMSAFLFLMSC